MTLKELIRSKMLYGIFGISLCLLLAATAFATVSIGNQAKVIKDFGLFLITISSATLATIGGSTLLSKELSKKTIYNLLSKPVSRHTFIIGKFLGILALCITVIGISTAALMAYASLFEGQWDFKIAVGGCYILLEAVILCGAALFFSSLVVTPALSGVFSFALFLAGRGLDSILALVQNSELSFWSQKAILSIYWILPQTFRFTVANDLVYGIVPPLSYFLDCTMYAASYTGVLLVIASLLFSKRDFN